MTDDHDYYQALLRKDTQYEGVFFVGVKTTGIFCNPSCPARKPKFENCIFYKTREEALLAGFRPCKRCRPLDNPHCSSTLVDTLVELVEDDLTRRWRADDLRHLGYDPRTVSRHFEKRLGMTFIQYARARRLGLAFTHIRQGSSVIDTQLDAGYESSSGFFDAFSKIMQAPPSRASDRYLKSSWIDTPLGPMIAIGDDDSLFLLEFVDRRGLEREIERVRIKTRAPIIPGTTPPLTSIKEELAAYFAGSLTTFTTPLALVGSPFQKKVWHALCQIPYGTTTTYGELAKAIDHPTACRAVGRANGANQLALVIPCHRVIGKDGLLTGYGGGLPRKEWLLGHEKKISP